MEDVNAEAEAEAGRFLTLRRRERLADVPLEKLLPSADSSLCKLGADDAAVSPSCFFHGVARSPTGPLHCTFSSVGPLVL